MLWLAGLSCFFSSSEEAPHPRRGPKVEPGTYSFYAGRAPGCVEDPPDVQLVHLTGLTPIRSTVLNRSGRFHQVDVRGTEGWLATAHADDPRIITVLSSDEPEASCLQAEIEPLGDDRWLARTASWISLLNLTTSEARHLAKASGDLEGCRTHGEAVRCRGPHGAVHFDRDGVGMRGQYEPAWSEGLRR